MQSKWTSNSVIELRSISSVQHKFNTTAGTDQANFKCLFSIGRAKPGVYSVSPDNNTSQASVFVLRISSILPSGLPHLSIVLN